MENDVIIDCEPNKDGVFEEVKQEVKTKPILKRRKRNKLQKIYLENNIDKFFNGFEDGLEVIEIISERLRLW
jgi:hypothetical protein